jgi:cysteinyl-tRNA synthetase
MCDDLNTPLALAAMHALADRALAGELAAARELRAAGGLLGILRQSADAWFRGGADRPAIEAAIAERQEARRRRDYKRADAIRAEWSARGVVFEDRPDGSTNWSIAATPAVADQSR